MNHPNDDCSPTSLSSYYSLLLEESATDIHPNNNSDQEQDSMMGASSSSSSSNAHTIASTEATSSLPSLPPILWYLFGVNGLSLGLLSLPLLYLLNTRIQMPLAYFPFYGALSFLPYSFKPLYGHLSDTLLCGNSSSTSSNTSTAMMRDRSTLFCTLLALTGALTMAYAWIDTIGWIYVVSFFRGITDSWSELCLGVTLIDDATRATSQGAGFDSRASVFQSQAATARNVGSFLASILTTLFFVGQWLWYATSHTTKEYHTSGGLTGSVVSGILLTTGLLQLTTAVVTKACYADQFVSCPGSHQRPQRNEDALLSSSLSPPSSFTRRTDEESAPLLPTSEPALNHYDDAERNHNASTTSTQSHYPRTGHVVMRNHSSSGDSVPERLDEEAEEAATLLLEQDDGQKPWISLNGMLVILLQVLVVIVSVGITITRHDSVTRTIMWYLATGVALVVAMLIFQLNRCNQWTQAHQVGIFLVLRHAIPNDSLLVGSLVYYMFQEFPLLLQLLTLAKMASGVGSAWTYEKVLSKHSAGRPFLTVLVTTTVAAALASLSAVVLCHSDLNWIKGDGKSSTDDAILLFWKVLVIQVVRSFFSELAFLPDVVLATTALQTQRGAESHYPNNETSTPHLLSHTESLEGATGQDRLLPSSVSTSYGCLLSCLDFGDNVGALLTGPLVVLFDISRDQEFKHLDRLIVTNSALTIVSIGLVLLLLPQKACV